MEFPSPTLSASGSLKSPPLDQARMGKHSLPFPWRGRGGGGKRKHMAGQLHDNSLQRNSVSNLSDPSLALPYIYRLGGEVS